MKAEECSLKFFLKRDNTKDVIMGYYGSSYKCYKTDITYPPVNVGNHITNKGILKIKGAFDCERFEVCLKAVNIAVEYTIVK